jgi:putative oxidoreductase
MNSGIILLARVLLAILFIVAGFGKLTGGAAGLSGMLGGMGFPAPMLVAYLVGIIEFVGGLAILVGFVTRPVAYVLALFTVGTILIAHMGADQSTQAMKNLAIVGGFLLLAVTGAGAYSVDAKRGVAAPKFA